MNDEFKKPGSIPFEWELQPGIPKPFAPCGSIATRSSQSLSPPPSMSSCSSPLHYYTYLFSPSASSSPNNHRNRQQQSLKRSIITSASMTQGVVKEWWKEGKRSFMDNRRNQSLSPQSRSFSLSPIPSKFSPPPSSPRYYTYPIPISASSSPNNYRNGRQQSLKKAIMTSASLTQGVVKDWLKEGRRFMDNRRNRSLSPQSPSVYPSPVPSKFSPPPSMSPSSSESTPSQQYCTFHFQQPVSSSPNNRNHQKQSLKKTIMTSASILTQQVVAGMQVTWREGKRSIIDSHSKLSWSPQSRSVSAQNSSVHDREELEFTQRSPLHKGRSWLGSSVDKN